MASEWTCLKSELISLLYWYSHTGAPFKADVFLVNYFDFSKKSSKPGLFFGVVS